MDYFTVKNSGKPFKRKHHAKDAWLTTKWPGFTGTIDHNKEYAYWHDTKTQRRKGRDNGVYFSEADLKADDWEVKGD